MGDPEDLSVMAEKCLSVGLCRFVFVIGKKSMNRSVTGLQKQASRCMDCGIPFCNNGCPLGNLIPDWNDLVYKITGEKLLMHYMQQIIFPNLQDAYAQHPVKQLVLGIHEDPVLLSKLK